MFNHRIQDKNKSKSSSEKEPDLIIDRTSDSHKTLKHRTLAGPASKKPVSTTDKPFQSKLRSPQTKRTDKRMSSSQLAVETRKDRIMKVVQDANNLKLMKQKLKNDHHLSDKDKKTENSGSNALKESATVKVSSTVSNATATTTSTTSTSNSTTSTSTVATSVEISTNGKSTESTPKNSDTTTTTAPTNTPANSNTNVEAVQNKELIDLTENDEVIANEKVQNSDEKLVKEETVKPADKISPIKDDEIIIISSQENKLEQVKTDLTKCLEAEKESENHQSNSEPNATPDVESTTPESVSVSGFSSSSLSSTVSTSTCTSSKNEADTDNETKNKEESSNSTGKNDNDASFISYDSKIMLKDVKIKLNDCLKDNSKVFDTTEQNDSINDSYKDLSFGRTLRNISGRNSLGRLRHVTTRDTELSPNDSLFVNTSSLSSTERSPPIFDSPYPYNRIDNKRKLTPDNDDNEESRKKPRSDNNNYSFFNSSLEYIRNFRKPIEVSSPKVEGYKFNLNEKNTNESINNIEAIDNRPISQKWCLIM